MKGILKTKKENKVVENIKIYMTGALMGLLFGGMFFYCILGLAGAL